MMRSNLLYGGSQAIREEFLASEFPGMAQLLNNRARHRVCLFPYELRALSIPGQVHRGGAVVRSSYRSHREGFRSESSRSCLIAQQPGGVADRTGE